MVPFSSTESSWPRTSVKGPRGSTITVSGAGGATTWMTGGAEGAAGAPKPEPPAA